MMLVEVAAFAALVFLILSLANHSRKHRLPPSPLALPIIGHLHLLSRSVHSSFSDLSARYGPLIYLKLGSVPCVVASTPELARELLKANELSFASRNTSIAIDYLTYNSSFSFAPYGPYWKFVKKLSMVELVGSRNLSQFLPIRTKELHQFLRRMLVKCKTGQSVDVSQELLMLTSNIISQMMLRIRCSDSEGQADEARTLVREVTQIFGEFNLSDFIWCCRKLNLQGFRKRIESIHRRYDAFLEKIIADREQRRKMKKSGEITSAEDDVKDFLDVMLDVMESENLEVEFTRNHIKALVLDFFTAGTDTTAITVEWALAELINHPKLLKKAKAELDQVVGKKRLVEESDTANLPYIQAVLKEALRLHPPVPFISRKTTQDCEIQGFLIPANTLLFVNTWSIGRDPKYWPNPLEFQPERFLSLQNGSTGDEAAGLDVKGQHFQLLPFGTGRRGCPGLPLAMQEVTVTLAAMIQCFDWKVDKTHEGVINGDDAILDMTERPGLTAPRAHNLFCVPVPRFSLIDMLQQ